MRNILLIEDNPEMRENTTEILELAGYHVHSAENGKIGVDLAQKNLPDLIICDVMMPVLDGYGVLHILSKNSKTTGIPFIFLTAKAEKEDFRKGMNLGADDYITKPFNDVELLDAIETRFRKTELLKKEFAKNIDGLNEFMNKVESFDALIKLTGDRKCRPYKKKELIFSEGSHPSGVFFINKGKIKTFKTNEDGKEYITGLFKEGDFIGYTAVLEDSNFTESATALEDADVCLIQRQDFLTLLYSNREVANKFIKLLSDNLIEKEDRLLSLAYNSVRKRVAEALLMLRERYKVENNDDFSIHISREDLSNIVGTATESLIRTLSDFKDEGMIELKAGQVKIVDVRKLEHMKF
jgi:CRP/FNR family transcriptional regulator, polysaccharide utilization system transcription regulator